MRVEAWPELTEGRGSELKPPVESIIRLFLYKGNVEEKEKKTWQLLPSLLRKDFFLLG